MDMKCLSSFHTNAADSETGAFPWSVPVSPLHAKQVAQQQLNADTRNELVISIIIIRIGTIYEDVTADVLGNTGFWQRVVIFVSTILMTNSLFSHHEDIYLLPPSTSSVVCIPADLSEIYNETLCTFTLINGTREMPCHKWYVKLLWVFWIKKSWIIFCDDKMKLLLTAVIYRLARVFGFVIFGLVADSFGRRRAIILDVFGSLVLRLVISFCDSEGWFRLVLFLLSLLGSANIFMGLVIVCEIASNKWRSWLSVIVMSPRLFAAVCSLPLATSAPNSETYNLIACFIGILYIISLKWLPESPQWLLYNRKIKLAEKIIYKAAQQNNINFSAEFKIRPVNQRAYKCLDDTTTCARILTIHNIRVIISVSLVFWGLFNFLWGSLYLKIYINGIEKALFMKICLFYGILGCLGVLLSKKLTLQQLMAANIALTGIFTAGVVIFKQPITHEIFCSTALASGLIVHTLSLIITPRLYAINVRATLLGCCHAMGQLGALISYIFFICETMDDVIFIASEVGVTLVLVAVSFMLPHVDGRELPDVIEDMDYFSELSKPLRWATQKTTSPSKEEVEMQIHSFGSVPTNSSGFASTSYDHNKSERTTSPAQLIDCNRYRKRFVEYIQSKNTLKQLFQTRFLRLVECFKTK